mmetsp:Transcript_13162/g.25516  ORF Transcript_13162/g.25516 Transcript_13162/m.25516 type:complete len:1478 (+) Transcript_13162:39-4472(+)
MYVFKTCPKGAETKPESCSAKISKFNFKSQDWSEEQVAGLDNEGVLQMTGQASAYDSVGKKMYIFGGYRVRTPSNGEAPRLAGPEAAFSNSLDYLSKDHVTGKFLWNHAVFEGALPPPSSESSLTFYEPDGRLILFGGFSTEGLYSDVFETTVPPVGTRWQWREAKVHGKAPTGRRGHTATLVLNQIFIFGGLNVDGHLNDLHVLTIPTAFSSVYTWQTIKPSVPAGVLVPAPRSSHSALLVNSHIFIFGGCDLSKKLCFNNVAVLDAINLAWVKVPDTIKAKAPEARQKQTMTRIHSQGSLVAILGGCNSAKCFKNIHVLDLEAVCPSNCHNGQVISHKKGPDVCECKDDFSGKFCDVKTRCQAGCHAPHQGACENSNGSFQCVCKNKFWGPDCGLPACPNNCGSHGLCKKSGIGEAKCFCEEGFSGDDCSKVDSHNVAAALTRGVQCHDGCSGHGKCEAPKLPSHKFGTCNCLPGFGGATCSVECPNECSSNGQCNEYGQCQCNAGYKGTDCSQKFCYQNCSSHGVCLDDKCFCKDGWIGEWCQIDTSCAGHGELVDGRCKCASGWGGPYCATALVCPHACYGRGKCLDSPKAAVESCDRVTGKCVHSPKAECKCELGFSGVACEYKQCPGKAVKDNKGASSWHMCSGAGTCNHNQGLCTCFPGYSGVDCSTVIPCKHNCTSEWHGTCQANGKCKCQNRFSGDDCSEIGCLNGCSNNGKCTDGVCTCKDGFAGVSCEIKCPNACSSRGQCMLDGKCRCHLEYEGADCSVVKSCPKSKINGKECGGRGICDRASQKCYCAPGYSGPDCSIDDGSCEVCKHGVCQHGHCFCDFGFSGQGCETKNVCEDDCMLRGVCHLGKCVCNAGFDGKKCEKMVQDKTCPKNCNNNGLCRYGRCFCLDGYSGADCSVEVGFCKKNKCSGKGVCKFNRCFCEPGASGKYCEIGGCKKCNPSQGMCVQGKCKCFPGFEGPDCAQTKTCPGTAGPCNYHGVCVRGVCACEPGYEGADCGTVALEAPTCPNKCSKRGVCHLGKCFCLDGFGGPDCGIQVDSACPKSCQPPDVPVGNKMVKPPRGDCLGGKCFCPPGFTGPACEEALQCSKECESNGVCIYGTCHCVPGWSGKNCNVRLGVTEAAAVLEKDLVKAGKKCGKAVHGCSQHGICLGDKCACETGYSGHDCATAQVGVVAQRCPNNCNSHGQCLFGKCYCDLGFAGADCALEVGLACPKDCHSRGVCHYGRCYCDWGFGGLECEKKVDTKNHPRGEPCDPNTKAALKAIHVADPEPSANGEKKAQPPTAKGNSSNFVVSNCGGKCGPHGVCVDKPVLMPANTCVCSKGFTGPECNIQSAEYNKPKKETQAMMTARFLEKAVAEFNCDSDEQCFNNGICHASKCFCAHSFGGPQCEVTMTPSSSGNMPPSLLEAAPGTVVPDCDNAPNPIPSIPMFLAAFLLGVLVSGVTKCVLDKRKQVKIQQQFLKPLLVPN